MSETAEPAGGGAPPEPAAPTTEAPAPAEGAPAAPETEETRQHRGDLRIQALRRQLAERDQEAARVRAENETLRQRIAPAKPEPVTAEDIPRLVAERVAAEVAQREVTARVTSFHEAGRAAHKDWQSKCDSLMEMGADAGFAELLVEMPDGVKVAAALAEDPDELERIAGLKSERGRAIALGKYSAALEARAPTTKAATKMPPPIRPISGTANPAFNPATATTDELIRQYEKEAREARAAR